MHLVLVVVPVEGHPHTVLRNHVLSAARRLVTFYDLRDPCLPTMTLLAIESHNVTVLRCPPGVGGGG